MEDSLQFRESVYSIWIYHLPEPSLMDSLHPAGKYGLKEMKDHVFITGLEMANKVVPCFPSHKPVMCKGGGEKQRGKVVCNVL